MIPTHFRHSCNTRSPGAPGARPPAVTGTVLALGGFALAAVSCGPSYVPATTIISALDRDSDGIPDKRDKCPSIPEDMDGFADYDGCPDTDMDNDTIADEKDRCPTLTETVNGLEDEDGCPDVVKLATQEKHSESDADGDTIPDAIDQCPTIAEVFNGTDDEDGCPDVAKIEKCQIQITGKVYFDYDSAVLKEESYPLLDVVAQLILSHPDLGVIRIEGHTDNVGDEEYNRKLSEARAISVGEYLVLVAGVPSERLVGVGYGESHPLSSAGTEEGREINRRVEFHIADCK